MLSDGRMNLWSALVSSTVNENLYKVPSCICTSLAIHLVTPPEEFTASATYLYSLSVTKVYNLPLSFAVNLVPAGRTTGFAANEYTLTIAFAALADLGVYPNCFASL